MQRPYNDRWERTRRYLLRNLFEYHGDLSPIREESGSDSSDDRPYSPLPDLVVERELNRHDHSEEFYEALAVRMRRLYRRLFIDGESELEATDNAADDFEFDVNRSMASTFIINTNDHTDEETHLIENVTGEEFVSIINVLDKTREVSKTIETLEEKSDASKVTDDIEKQNGTKESSRSFNRSDVATEKEEFKMNGAVNATRETQAEHKESSKSIDTESDLQESCHRTSTTVAQIHADVRVRAPRVFEDGSPVLMPKAHELSRSVFGNMSLKVRNIMSSVHDEEDGETGEGAETGGCDKDTQQASKGHEDLNQSKNTAEDSDLEVDWLMNTAQSVSNENHALEEGEEISARTQTSEGTSVELIAFDVKDRKEIEDESPLLTSESDEMAQILNEESIGPNEFDDIELSPKSSKEICEDEIVEPVENSFEMALSKGFFESKNARITAFQSSDEELESEGFEPLEVMRGTMQTRLTETLQRESTISKESPPVVKFATQATAEELEKDDSEYDVSQINASDAVMTESQNEDKSLQKELTVSRDSSVENAHGTQDDAEELCFSDDFECISDTPVDEENEISDDVDISTPPVAKTKSFADVCNDIWSVSPVNVNFEELLPNDHGTKKRTLDSDVYAEIRKKKRYSNIAIQTSVSKEILGDWDNVKNNFFVGKPLVFKLCSCHDHVCP